MECVLLVVRLPGYLPTELVARLGEPLGDEWVAAERDTDVCLRRLWNNKRGDEQGGRGGAKNEG